MQRKFKLDFLVTVAFAVLKPLAFLLVVPAVSSVLTPSALGLYFLVKRSASTLGALMQAGVSQTLMRKLAIIHDDNLKSTFVTTALLFLLLLSVVLFGAIWFNEDSIWFFLFEKHLMDKLVLYGLGALTFTYVLNYIVMAVLLAYRNILTLNVLQLLVGSGFVLIFIIIQSGKVDVGSVIFFEASSILILSGTVLIHVFHQHRLTLSIHQEKITSVVKEFRDYGLVRGITSSLDMFLFLVGSWLLVTDLEQTGYFLIALMVFKAVQSLVLPIGQLSGVILTKNIENKKLVVEGISFLVGIPVVVLLVGLPFFYPWMNLLLNAWLDDRVAIEVLVFLKIIIWGVLPYAIYQSLYVSIDMMWKKPKIFWVLVVAVLSHIVSFYFLSFFLSSSIAVATSFLIVMILLGFFTLIFSAEFLGPLRHLGLLRLLILAMISYWVNGFLAKEGTLIYFPLGFTLLLCEYYVYMVIFPSKFAERLKSKFLNKKG